MKIPGLSFSWKRAVGLSGLRARIARKTGIPTTKGGLQRKVGAETMALFRIIIVMVLSILVALIKMLFS